MFFAWAGCIETLGTTQFTKVDNSRVHLPYRNMKRSVEEIIVSQEWTLILEGPPDNLQQPCMKGAGGISALISFFILSLIC